MPRWITLWFAFLALVMAGTADAGQIYGTIYLHDIKSDEVRVVDDIFRLEVVMDGQRLMALSKPDGTYRMRIARRGSGTISLEYRGVKLTGDIESRSWERNYELYIQHYGDRYRLVPISKRIRRPRRVPPEANPPQ